MKTIKFFIGATSVCSLVSIPVYTVAWALGGNWKLIIASTVVWLFSSLIYSIIEKHT